MARSLAAAVLALALAPVAGAQDVTKAQVQAAIDRAVQYLERQQNADGSFTDARYGRAYPQGTTAMAAYALLLAGVKADHPVVARALRYVVRAPHQRTYSVGLAALALAEADPVRYREPLQKIARWLMQAQLGSGMWTYVNSGAAGGGHRIGDNSNSQFGVLGLWGCKRAGIEIPDRVWKVLRDYWRGAQTADGAWGYRPGAAGRTAMTCAGIASLLIANAELRRATPE